MSFSGIRAWADSVKTNTYALYLAARHPGVPRIAKIVIGLVVGYALSPIDLIPDFIPVIGYLDDLLLLPMGIWLAIRLIPSEVWRECQTAAQHSGATLPESRRAAVVIVLIWAFSIALSIHWLRPVFLGSVKP